MERVKLGRRMTEEIKDETYFRLKEEYLSEPQHLEQENNSLQAQLNNITVQSNNAITALEQENKELKEKVKSREDELANMAEQANMRINTYRSVLEEIQKVIKGYDLTVDNGASVDTLYTIRKIINEVLK